MAKPYVWIKKSCISIHWYFSTVELDICFTSLSMNVFFRNYYAILFYPLQPFGLMASTHLDFGYLNANQEQVYPISLFFPVLRSWSCVVPFISSLIQNPLPQNHNSETAVLTKNRYLSCFSPLRAEILVMGPSFTSSLVGLTRSCIPSPFRFCRIPSNCSNFFYNTQK